MRRRHELTDKQWDKIKGHLPGQATDPGRVLPPRRHLLREEGPQLRRLRLARRGPRGDELNVRTA